MLACGLALALWSLPALASNGQGKALSEDKVADVCKLSALLKKMSLEAKKLGSVATLATGFEASAAEEDMHVMREALGSAARLLRRRARRGADTRNETQAREMAERVVRLHEAEQTKALAAQLAENVRQRTLLTAAPIDIRIKTFAANFQGSNVARIVAQSGTGNGKAQAERFATTDTQAGGCAATADKVATAMLPQQKMPTQDNEWQQAITAAEASKRDMLVGSESTTKCTLTASTETATPEPPRTPHSHGASSGNSLDTAHQAASNSNGQTHTRLRHRKTEKRGRAERNVAALQAAKGNAPTNAQRVQRSSKRRASGSTRSAAPFSLWRRKQEHAPRHSEKGHGGRRQRRGAQGTARRSHRARSEDTGKRKHAKGRSTGRHSNATEQAGRTQGTSTADTHSSERERSARQQLPATSTRRSSDSCRVSCGSQEPKARTRMRNGTSQQPSQQAMSTRLSAKQKRATREGRQSDTVHSSNAK
ncbi:hypothetical protein ERJ75_001715900 [Trypanosoma vivax]|nr:hypothetical protein ERJ75_001715900 [Trypanosoma vivax]